MYKIRSADPKDENSIRELFLEMLYAIYHTKDVEGYEDGYLDRFWEGQEDRIFVAEEDKVIAFLSVEVHHEAKEFIYLDDLSVAEPYRGQGIGTALIRQAEEYAKSISIPNIVLHVEKNNLQAMRLYERLGFKRERDDGERYLLRKGM